MIGKESLVGDIGTLQGGRESPKWVGHALDIATAPVQVNWFHSDMKDMAYFYVYPLYDELKTKGSLK